jgi:exodeoxyribonuclease VII large subunit
MLYPVPVQGEGAGAKIAAAIAHLNASIVLSRGADLILLSRGGGSLEDLWAFNEEVVARAIAASRIPVVTGIGHEVDVSIADLVADHHAHTPTEAAQVITAQWRGVSDRLNETILRLARGLRGVVVNSHQRLKAVERHEAFRRPLDRVNMLRQLLDDRQRALVIAQERLLRDRRDRTQNAGLRLHRFLPAILIRFRESLRAHKERLDRSLTVRLRIVRARLDRDTRALQEHHPRLRIGLAAQQIDAARFRLDRAMMQQMKSRASGIDAIARQLDAVSPQSVLKRGYTITTRKKGGGVLRSVEQVKPGDKLITRFADGEVESIAEDSKQLSLFE